MTEPAQKLPPAVLTVPEMPAANTPEPEQLLQLHLNGDRMNGRGVRIRILSPALVREAEENGAKIAGPTATLGKLRTCQIHECLRLMVRAVTVKPGLKNLQDPGIEWKPVDAGLLLVYWDTFFGEKETQVLTVAYNRFHEVTVGEVDAILGKALPVAGD